MLFASLARRYVRVGALTVIEGGRSTCFGNGEGPDLRVELTGAAAVRIATDPELKLGEAYMDGSLKVLSGDIYELLDLVGRNFQYDGQHQRFPFWRRAWFAAQRQLQQVNSRAVSRHNVEAHYDLSLDLYRRFLDTDLQYSCAYFERPDMTLEAAQAAKKAHIARKLALRSGDRVLDIGCGWGGMGLTLAQDWGAQVQGVTLSTEQLATARARAEAAGLSGRAKFDMIDYRDVPGPFDRIVSIGMFEHVGRPNYQAYFDRVAELLTDDGVALIHAIGRKDEPNVTNPWVRKYIFPGGYIPALSEVLPAIERAGLWVTDLEVMRLHYAETLRHWRTRFAARRAEIVEIYDERLARMFEFYLAVSEVSFRWGGHMIWQVQLSKRVDALPLTRNYMFDAQENGSNGAEASTSESLAIAAE